jgi:hypothetical protein
LKTKDFLARKFNILGFSYNLNVPGHRLPPKPRPFTFLLNRKRAAIRVAVDEEIALLTSATKPCVP